MNKKKAQLGIDPSTASGRLVKDLLFDFVKNAGHTCLRCNLPMDRNNFSVDHVVPWLDSEDPVKLFFDLDNVAYSHIRCNSSSARRPHKRYENEAARLKARDARRKAQRLQSSAGVQRPSMSVFQTVR